MRNRILIHIAAAAIGVAALAACSSIANESTYSSQETKIDSWVASQVGECDTISVVRSGDLTTFTLARKEDEAYKDTVEVTYSKGTTRLTLQRGRGDALLKRGTVTFYYAGFDFSKGSVSKNYLFATNNADFASSVSWECVTTEPVTISPAKADIVEGLKNGLVGVKEGEDCYILFSGKYGYGSRDIGTIPANAPLAFRVWVEGVEN